MKVAVCDDIPYIANNIEGVLTKYDRSLFEVDIYYNPLKLLKNVKEANYDFFVLDIEFPGFTGIQIAEQLRNQNIQAPIVFLTSHRKYMEEVFCVQPFDYIVKPITTENFFPVVERMLNYLNKGCELFTFSFKKKQFYVRMNDIVYFEKNRRQAIVHTSEKEYITIVSTPSLLTKLSENFVQVHTSFIINIHFIKVLKHNSLILENQKKQDLVIPISRKYKQIAREKILIQMRKTI